MNQQNIPLKLILLSFSASLLLSFNGSCQVRDSSQNHNLPAMWISKNDTSVHHYRVGRKAIMETEHKGQPDSYLFKGWMNMLNYFDRQYPDYTCIHAYICAFTKNQRDPADKKNKLAIVFVPTIVVNKNNVTELGYYRFLDNDSFYDMNAKNFTIKRGKMRKWSHNYQKHFLKHLSRDIDNTDEENQNRNHTCSDTWCIGFCKSLLQELECERTLIHADATNTRQIEIGPNVIFSFAAKKDTVSNGSRKSGRLFFSLDYTDATNQAVLLDTLYGFSKRYRTIPVCQGCNDNKGLDNAQLCPPAANCPLKQ